MTILKVSVITLSTRRVSKCGFQYFIQSTEVSHYFQTQLEEKHSTLMQILEQLQCKLD